MNTKELIQQGATALGIVVNDFQLATAAIVDGAAQFAREYTWRELEGSTGKDVRDYRSVVIGTHQRAGGSVLLNCMGHSEAASHGHALVRGPVVVDRTGYDPDKHLPTWDQSQPAAVVWVDMETFDPWHVRSTLETLMEAASRLPEPPVLVFLLSPWMLAF